MAYDTTNYGLIRDQLLADHQRVSANNRAQLLDDAFTLALTELISYAQALDLTLYLKYERDYVPWHAVLTELNYIDIMLYNFVEFPNWKVPYKHRQLIFKKKREINLKFIFNLRLELYDKHSRTLLHLHWVCGDSI